MYRNRTGIYCSFGDQNLEHNGECTYYIVIKHKPQTLELCTVIETLVSQNRKWRIVSWIKVSQVVVYKTFLPIAKQKSIKIILENLKLSHGKRFAKVTGISSKEKHQREMKSGGCNLQMHLRSLNWVSTNNSHIKDTTTTQRHFFFIEKASGYHLAFEH